jgi:hypothetical protein
MFCSEDEAMRCFGTILFILATISCAVAVALPLTAKEIGLMLRSGYSSDAVVRELSTRKFADTFDADVEKQLTQSGAKPALIEALRSGTYQLSASEIAEAKMKLAAKEQITAKPFDQPASTEETKPSPPATEQSAPPPDNMLQHLKDSLICIHHGSLVRCDDDALENKRLFLLFFSATWSAPARKFTPQLVEYYNRVAPEHPEFEVVFFSADRSQYAMETYMMQSSMPWPALGYDKRSGPAGDIEKGLVHEIPSLVLVDGRGKVLSYSHGGDNEVLPEKVLSDLDQILAHGAAATAAQKN